MELKNIQRKELKTIVISIRTTKKDSKWMRDKNISPSKLFHEALNELKEKK